MRLILADMPDDAAQLGSWLDQQLVGIELAELVDELAVVSSRSAASATLDDVCGHRLGAVLTSGCRALDEATLGRILVQPDLLLELQARVLDSGEPYWRQPPRTTVHQAATAAVWSAISASLPLQGALPAVFPGRRPTKRWSTIGVSLAAIAASLLLLVGLWRGQTTPEQPWGWNRPDAFLSQGGADQYLTHLASLGEEWFIAMPDSKPELAQRLNQMLAGCDALVAAKHADLAEPDRQWLRERCSQWRDKFAAQLRDLEGGQSIAQIQADADSTVRALLQALRKRRSTLTPSARSQSVSGTPVATTGSFAPITNSKRRQLTEFSLSARPRIGFTERITRAGGSVPSAYEFSSPHVHARQSITLS